MANIEDERNGLLRAQILTTTPIVQVVAENRGVTHAIAG